METMTVFDMLHYGSPVWSDRDRALIVTWNGSQTYNVWMSGPDGFYNADCFSNDSAKTIDEARSVAENRMKEGA